MAQGKGVIVLGAGGRMAQLLMPSLIARFGESKIVAFDKSPERPATLPRGIIHIQGDLRRYMKMSAIAMRQEIGTIIHVASPPKADFSGKVVPSSHSMISSVLDLCYKERIKLFFASSFEVYGANHSSPLVPPVPENTPLAPGDLTAMFKLYSELAGRYVWALRGLDFRAIRYPIIVAPEIEKTSDCGMAFVSHMFRAAKEGKPFTVPVSRDKRLPMIHAEDCGKATIQLIDRERSKLTQPIYNLPGISASPAELLLEIRKHKPQFKCDFSKDNGGPLESLPSALAGEKAAEDWGWRSTETLTSFVARGMHQT